MSRIGRKPIDIPGGVTVKYDNDVIHVKEPKGELSSKLNADMIVNIEGDVITIDRPSETKAHPSLHGTTRSIIDNMINGVSEGYSKSLELVGVGYRASKSGNKVVLNVGFSHP